MGDPLVEAQLKSHADRLRALEDKCASEGRFGMDDGLDGVREYSRAWHENRSTAYLLTKTWADPVSRIVLLLVISIIGAGWLYLWFQ